MRVVPRSISLSTLRRGRLSALILAGALLAPSAALPQAVDLGVINNGSDSFCILGIDGGATAGLFGDESGSGLSCAGDVNGDGLADLVIGALLADGIGNGFSNAGEAYLVYGNRDAYNPPTELAQLSGNNGAIFRGTDVEDRLGRMVAGIGDFNGDGYDDILLGAYLADGPGNLRTDTGESYVIFGKPTPFATPLDLSNLTASEGFAILGAGPAIASADRSGRCVSGAGDVNADGFADILIGAPTADGLAEARPNCGEVYVIYGTAASMGASFDLSSINGVNGSVIYGAGASDEAGTSCSGATDINGDGISDIVIGAPRADGPANARPDAGDCHVVFGTPGGFGASLDLALLTGANGFTLYGVDGLPGPILGDRTGFSVAGTGDVNGDGYGDFVLGANSADGPANAALLAGDSYLVFGKSTFPATVDLAALAAPDGMTLYGIDASDLAGWSVSGPGDINGDGFMDVIIGAYFGDGNPLTPPARTNSGENFLLFGKSAAFPTSMNLSAFSAADGNIYYGLGGGDWTGWNTSTAGDRNGDGATDFVTCALFADGLENLRFQAGDTQVIHGTAASLTATYRAFAQLGDAQRIPIGITGDGCDDSFPASRLWVDFADGTNTSLQTVTLTRSNSSITGLTSPADVMWEFATNRLTWTSATVSVRYTNDEIGAFAESGLQLYFAAAPTGPWSPVATTIDADRNIASGAITTAGFLALAGDSTDPSALITLNPTGEEDDFASWTVSFDEAIGGTLDIANLTSTGTVGAEFAVVENLTDYTVFMNFTNPDQSGTASFSISGITDLTGNPLSLPADSPVHNVVNYVAGDLNKDGGFDLSDVALASDVNLGLTVFP